MISDFIRVFDRDLESFKNYEPKKEIIELLFEVENNNEVIDIIKQDIREDEGYIFTNLLSLYPFSAKLVVEVLKSGFIEKKDLLKNLDIIFDSVAGLKELLIDLKQLVRNNEGISFSKIEERLNEVEKELKKYESNLQKKKELKEKINQLNYLKQEVKDIEDLEKYLKKLKDTESTIKKLNRKINESKKLFKHLCKDET
jgi:DNA repair exonuclease SbcCD ATPase subunit